MNSILSSKNIANNSSFILSRLTRAFLVMTLFCTSIMFSQTGLNDASFDPGTGANAGLNSTTLQSDGKILVSGGLIAYNGTTKKYIARVNTDGTLDATFNTGAGFNTTVYKAAELSTGKILAVGQFTTYAGAAAKRIARLNSATGTLDNTFNTGGAGLNTYAYSFVEQPDGKIIIVGGFFTYNGATRRYMARLNANGTLDNTWNPIGANAAIYEIALQPDGKSVIGGLFTTLNSATVSRLARLNTDGSTDPTFVVGSGIAGAPTTTATAVQAIAIQPDGKILIGGNFATYNGTTVNNIMRLNTNGSIDATFLSGVGLNSYVKSIIIQADGKILVAGAFTTYNGTSKLRIMRLNSDGTIDPAFNGTGTNFTINSMALQTDKNLIVGGDFITYDGASRTRIARVLNACPTVTASLTGHTNNLCNTGSTGTATVSAVGGFSFTYTWSPSGGNAAVATGLAPGTYTCNISNECANTGSVTVTITAPTTITVTPGSNATICNGSSTSLSASASGGTAPFTYDWTPGNLPGSAPTVTPSSTTVYTVTATDANGCTNSANQTISVPSAITVTAGSNITICNGSSTSLSASASGGTAPFTYNWMPGNLPGSAPTVTPSSTTVYTVTATDANGCTNSANQTVSVPSAITVSTPSNVNMCNGSSTSLSASASGGTAPFTYNWMPGNLSGSSPSVSPSSTTSYTVTATDANGCTGSANETVTVLPAIVATAGSNTTICSGSTATLSANASGGSGSFTYDWTPGNIAGSTATVNPSSTTVYTVTATDGNGCTASATQMITVSGACATSTVPCGVTFNNMSLTSTSGSNSTSAANVSGAVNYKFNFYDNITNALVGTKTQASRTCTFSTISGIYYGKTYKWSVSVDKGTGFGAQSTPCTITFAPPQTSVPCGSVYANLNAYTACQAVGKATNYRFTIYNNTTNAVIATKIQTSNYLYFNTITGLTYGNTYKLTVEVEYNNAGTGSLVYGPASSNTCTISFDPPQTTVPCGNTYAQNGYSGLTTVNGALGYRWSFYDATTMALVATKTNTTSSGYVYFNQVSGLVYNKAYKWTVEVYYNNGTTNLYGPPSSNACTMNYGTPGPLIHNPNQNEATARLMQQSIDSGNHEVLVDVFPNPTKDKITVVASEAIRTIKIYNISNQLVLSAETTNEMDLGDLKAGIYFINVDTENGTKHLKIIKE